MNSIIRKFCVWFPIALSLWVLATMITYITFAGVSTREADEGMGAHLFQIWLVFEIVMIVFFAGKYLPHTPKQALMVLALQIVAVLAAMAPIYFFHL